MSRSRNLTILSFSPLSKSWYALMGAGPGEEVGWCEPIVGWAVVRDEDAEVTYVAPMSTLGVIDAVIRDPRDESNFIELVDGSVPADPPTLPAAYLAWERDRIDTKRCVCTSWSAVHCARHHGTWAGEAKDCVCDCHKSET